MALHTREGKIWLLLGGSAPQTPGSVGRCCGLRRPGSNAKDKSAAVAASMNGKYLGWPWSSHGSAMARPWLGHGAAMARPWRGHGSAMAQPWLAHGSAMARPWLGHGLAMARPWFGHGSAMAQSLPLHVRLSHGHAKLHDHVHDHHDHVAHGHISTTGHPSKCMGREWAADCSL